MPSASATDLTIANAALHLLGESEMASFSDDTATAEMCNDTFEDTVRMLLCELPWRFAIKEKDLGTENGTEPINRWDERFALPTEGTLLKVLGVFVADRPVEYEILGAFIHVNALDEDNPVCRYIFRADTADFSPVFIEALTYRLAAKWAIPVTENTGYAETYTAMAERVLRKAAHLNAQESSTKRLPVGRLKNVR